MAVDIVDLTTDRPSAPLSAAPAQEPYQVLLARAVHGTQPGRLRRIIIDLCQKAPQYAELLGDQLLVSEALMLSYNEEEVKACNSDEEADEDDGDEDDEDSEEDEISENDNSDDDGDSAIQKVVKVPKVESVVSTKRLCPRYATCEHCEGEFDVASNGKYNCIWHDGELDYNDESSTWDDWEHGAHGERDTEDNREAYPEGFLWTCCERIGNKEGCHISRHKEKDETYKRPRI